MTNSPGVDPRHRWLPQRYAAAVIALSLAAVVSVGIAAWRELFTAPSISAEAALSSELLESPSGEAQARHFESLNGARLTRTTGPAVFMTGSWTIRGRIDRDCQIQFAVHTGRGWQLFGWASDHGIANGTINAWGRITENSSFLSDYQTTVTLETSDSGKFVLVWQPATLDVELRPVDARIAYACGATGRSAVFNVTTTS
ncbi:hypothetical protein ABT369_52985 [Dactylosporangium sp. NPDC000244]|uniref:hypothetical protein n=1 Tax=Dactylosporangium sp. NPDC000244 TaxID=3154365 RepID=UPI00332A15A9